MAMSLWDPNHPEGQVYLIHQPDLLGKLTTALSDLSLLVVTNDGLWNSLQKYKVMDGIRLERCQVGEISADHVNRIVKYLQKDQVWKFHAFLKALFDNKMGSVIDKVLGPGASKAYTDHCAKDTGAEQTHDQGCTANGGASGSSIKRFRGLQLLQAQDYTWMDKHFETLRRRCGWVERSITVAVVDIIINVAHLNKPDNVEIVNCASKLPPRIEYLTEGETDPNKYAEHPHGTICAGIIEKYAPRSLIVGYNVGEYDEENKIWNFGDSAIINALERIDKRTDIDIVSMSFGSTTEDVSVTDILKRLAPKKILIAGGSNEGHRKANTIQYPAKLEEVIAVGSCDQDGKEAGHCPVGKELDFLMPGLGIEFAKWTENGTSFATPHLAAAAALILKAVESTQDDGIQKRQRLTATSDMRNLLIHACNDDGKRTEERGYGRPEVEEVDKQFLEEYIKTLTAEHDGEESKTK